MRRLPLSRRGIPDLYTADDSPPLLVLLAWSRPLLASLQNICSWLIGGGEGSASVLGSWVFLRSLGVIYLIAFLSLAVQVRGLLGQNGILPASAYLDAVRATLGIERFHAVPTIFWFTGASDLALQLACATGVILSVLLILGVAPTLCLVVLFMLYLSLFSVGQDFLSFQWDILLLEVGFLAILLSSFPSSPLFLILLWWLLLRFMVESGVVKLTSGDPTWHDLTALTYHYFSQPLPTWTAWSVHHMPLWFHKASALLMYAIEILLPVGIFLGRFPRLIAAVGIILLQVVIGVTGNYNFFNLLTITLTFPLFDDALWRAILPGRILSSVGTESALVSSPSPPSSLFVLTIFIVALYLTVSFFQLFETLRPSFRAPRAVRGIERFIDPFRIVNAYGLFRVMTTHRPEIIVEGSDDGVTWKTYEFRWKPGDVQGRPHFIAPHQPRLDWQMWFAALSRYERTPWFRAFLARLLEGSPAVLALLKENPFPDHPPTYVRAMLYEYHFTTPSERRATRAWWGRELVGSYSPTLSLP